MAHLRKRILSRDLKDKKSTWIWGLLQTRNSIHGAMKEVMLIVLFFLRIISPQKPLHDAIRPARASEALGLVKYMAL